jgi:hypothetical protein
MHAIVERLLSGMAKRRVAEVVSKRYRFREILVEPQRARDSAGDLGDFEAVSQAGTEQVALVIDEDLRLVFETPKGGRVYDPVPVALEFAAMRRLRVRVMATARVDRGYRIRRQVQACAQRSAMARPHFRQRRSVGQQPARLLQEDQTKLAALHLLVVLHQLKVAVDASIGPYTGRPAR